MKITLSELIDFYVGKFDKNDDMIKNEEISSSQYHENYSKFWSDLESNVKKLEHDKAVNELIEYFKIKTYEKQWDFKDRFKDKLWIGCVLDFPETVFIPYLTDILKQKGENVPYYPVLDVLAYVPEDVGKYAVEGLCEAIGENNPYWSDSIFQAAFQALIFIGDEKGYDFIYKSCPSEIESISKWATYYRDNWILIANVQYLINKYVPDRDDLFELIENDLDSVKYILAEIDKEKACDYSPEDLDLIKLLVYYFV